MDRANARVDEFIRFRTELVRMSREVNLVELRNWGDNDANRNNRTALNKEIPRSARRTTTSRTPRAKRSLPSTRVGSSC